MNDKVAFLGMRFDLISAQGLEEWISRRSAASQFAYVVTPNVDHVVRFDSASNKIRDAYLEADKCVCDSRILRKFGQIFGLSLDVVTGSDLVANLFHRILEAGDRVCLIGGDAFTYNLLQSQFPKFELVHHDAPMNLLADSAARERAVAFAQLAKARVTLLAVGSPQQELIALEMKNRGTLSGTALCIGASVDFLVGTQKRAPLLIQHANLEWAWRLVTQPRRLAKRYLVRSPAIFVITFKWWKSQRIARGAEI